MGAGNRHRLGLPAKLKHRTAYGLVAFSRGIASSRDRALNRPGHASLLGVGQVLLLHSPRLWQLVHAALPCWWSRRAFAKVTLEPFGIRAHVMRSDVSTRPRPAADGCIMGVAMMWSFASR